MADELRDQILALLKLTTGLEPRYLEVHVFSREEIDELTSWTTDVVPLSLRHICERGFCNCYEDWRVECWFNFAECEELKNLCILGACLKNKCIALVVDCDFYNKINHMAVYDLILDLLREKEVKFRESERFYKYLISYLVNYYEDLVRDGYAPDEALKMVEEALRRRLSS